MLCRTKHEYPLAEISFKQNNLMLTETELKKVTRPNVSHEFSDFIHLIKLCMLMWTVPLKLSIPGMSGT